MAFLPIKPKTLATPCPISGLPIRNSLGDASRGGASRGGASRDGASRDGGIITFTPFYHPDSRGIAERVESNQAIWDARLGAWIGWRNEVPKLWKVLRERIRRRRRLLQMMAAGGVVRSGGIAANQSGKKIKYEEEEEEEQEEILNH